MIQKQIVAGSGGFQFIDRQLKVGPILNYALELTKKERPKLCYVGTATGDAPERIASFYDACSRVNVAPSHLSLFPMPNHQDVEAYVLSQDIIWVGGGSVVNMLAVWRAHGLDVILKKAWERGIILGGVSAGSICWNKGGTTDSFGVNLRPVTNGLGFLPYSSGVHYDSEPERRPLFQKLIKDGMLPSGYATEDGVSLHFIDTELHQALSDTPGKRAYHVVLKEGAVVETVIEPTVLH